MSRVNMPSENLPISVHALYDYNPSYLINYLGILKKYPRKQNWLTRRWQKLAKGWQMVSVICHHLPNKTVESCFLILLAIKTIFTLFLNKIFFTEQIYIDLC